MGERLRVLVTGTVQGVGFRPFVHRLATRLELAGTVVNGADGVEVDAEGPGAALERLLDALRSSPPPRARLEEITVLDRGPALGRESFRVLPSPPAPSGARPLVPPDAGPCPACLEEVLAGPGRRQGYPFTSCTDCGPRTSILRALPYDRARTAMSAFPLCAACQREYDDPDDRRYHSETQACPACGPRLRLSAPGERSLSAALALRAARERLARGELLAVKGVGGWQLACDARNEQAVLRLRERKRRPDKPLAVLVADAAAASALVELTLAARTLLESPARPIVIGPRRAAADLAPGVAPGLASLGVLLPPSPLHAQLASAGPLVLTSGNLHGQPMLADDDRAERELADVACAFLGHDRPVLEPMDDSVARDVPQGPLLLRRARGFVPEALTLPVAAPVELLALGADLKATHCVVRGRQAVVSQHLGDLTVPAVESRSRELRARLEALLGASPRALVCDLHPDMISTRLAEDSGLRVLRVQHHHAHAAAVLAEHGRAGPALALICDGMGYGDDGQAWGCELLEVRLSRARRLGRLRPVTLPGGDLVAREPWRAAVAHLVAAGLDPEACLTPDLDPAAVRGVAHLVRADHGVRSSSLGRLFDAAAAVCGLRTHQSYEAQAASELESAAAPGGDPYPLPLLAGGELLELDPGPLLGAMVEEVRRELPLAHLAARFHAGVAEGLLRALRAAHERTGLRELVLAGGCFANRRLLARVASGARAQGLEVLRPLRLPPGDGAISFGQAAAAAARLAEERQ